jgi:hypothetical protein
MRDTMIMTKRTATVKCPTCSHHSQSESRVYFVRYTTRVDHPEHRGPTYPQVAVDTRVQNLEKFTTAKTAKIRIANLLAGSDDFSSEFTSSIDAYSVIMTLEFDHAYRRANHAEVGQRSKFGKSYMRIRAAGSDKAELATD